MAQHFPEDTLCSCGSGQQKHALTDARGIFCAYVCGKCEEEEKGKYRPEIFTDCQYSANEPIDEYE